MNCKMRLGTADSEVVRKLILQSDALKRSAKPWLEPKLLMGRENILPELSSSRLTEAFSHKTVLITGGGGSIGSELCRQVTGFNIKRLIILDIYENNAYELQQELRHTFGDALDCRVEIASVRDEVKLKALFLYHRPDIILHAAAHKHVPLMEASPSEAVKNNILGTYNVMKAAQCCGAERFILISTDKAVEPTSVMGATKRFCELMLQAIPSDKTVFAAVRFGNVLGTSGSVLPLFKRQIELGGPVTLTDKRAVRYFMTAAEAAQLVLHAAVMAKQSQVFVLDMGCPVNILVLAETLITLMGLKPYDDIAIIEEGLRPGEKLHEELLISANPRLQTHDSKIFIECQPQLSPDNLLADLQLLEQVVMSGSAEAIRFALQAVVPEYRPKAAVI